MMRLRKGLVAGIASLGILGAGIAASAPAEASPYGFRGHGYGYHGGFRGGPRFGYRHGYGPGFVGAGLVGGLALGALAAGAYGGYGCGLERRVTYDAWGNPFWRNVRVCY